MADNTHEHTNQKDLTLDSLTKSARSQTRSEIDKLNFIDESSYSPRNREILASSPQIEHA